MNFNPNDLCDKSHETETHKHMLIHVLQMVYRKHHLGDESIGWEELSDKMLDVLGTVMGDEEFVNWQELELERIETRGINPIQHARKSVGLKE